MQISADDILSKAKTIVESLGDGVLNDLSHESAKNRQVAVNTILTKLNPKVSPEDNHVLQSLPIAMMASDCHIGALYFLQSCISNGAYFDPTIIGATIGEISNKRYQCIMSGDNEAAEVILKILQQLYNIILADGEYQKIPEIYLSIGVDQERNNDRLTAIGLYNEALGLGSIESYIYLGNAYESNCQYDMSANIFSIAYQLSREIRFLHRLIHALCKSGKREQAYHLYTQLQKESNRPIVSFVVYLGDIHNDDDLEEFSGVITQYHIVGSFEPSYDLSALAVNSSVYIANEIEKETHIIESLNSADLDLWTDEDDMEYERAISRRLWLMQTHMITLADPRYLEFYIEELREYTIGGNPRSQEMIRRFFADSFSPYVLARYNQVSNSDVVDTTSIRLYESMRYHLVQIMAMFSQFSCYDYIHDTVIPCIEQCIQQHGIPDEEYCLYNRGVIMGLRGERQEFDTFSPTTRGSYEKYIEYIDQKYGMFYRRSLQGLVRNKSSLPESLRSEYNQIFATNGEDRLGARDQVLANMPIFLNNPEVALFFLIEKIIAGQDILQEDDTIEKLTSRYQLYTLFETDALLFAAMLYERGGAYDIAVEYMLNIPNVLDIPQALSMITEGIRYMNNPEEASHLLQLLDNIAISKYDAESFLEQVSTLEVDILNDEESSDIDKAYISMAVANMKIYQSGDTEEACIGLRLAGSLGISQGYSSQGEILENAGLHNDAISSFVLAYEADPSISTIRRIIDCMMRASRFDEAWRYIEIGIRDDYDMSGSIFSWHLCQGNEKIAIEHLIGSIQSDNLVEIATLDDSMKLFDTTTRDILSRSNYDIETDALKVLASYAQLCMCIDPQQIRVSDFEEHLSQIESMMNSHEGDILSRKLQDTMHILVPDFHTEDIDSTSDRITALLHTHFTRMHDKFLKWSTVHIDQSNKVDTRKGLNSLISYFISILERFPHTDLYLIAWRDRINLYPTTHHLDHTLHRMPETIQ